MKRIIFSILTVLSLSAFTSLPNGLGDVISALKNGNASEISKHFDNTVEISMAGKSSNYSKSQGEAVLKDFFATHTVKSFNVVHKGEAGTSQFCIGTLVTSSGNFRTTINVKQKGDKYLVQEIKFDN
jgi:hypothetical protein